MSNTSIVVQFTTPGGESNAHLSAEIDSRPTGLNGGKSSFAPGETVYILVYKSTNVTVLPPESSAGSASLTGSTVVTLSEDLQFVGTTSASLNKPSDTGTADTQKWLGNNLGAVTVGPDKITASIVNKGVGVCRVGYQSTALILQLTSPTILDGEVDFTIVVLITGEVAP